MTTDDAPYTEEDIGRVAAAFAVFCDGLPEQDQPIMQTFLDRIAASAEVSGFATKPVRPASVFAAMVTVDLTKITASEGTTAMAIRG